MEECGETQCFDDYGCTQSLEEEDDDDPPRLYRVESGEMLPWDYVELPSVDGTTLHIGSGYEEHIGLRLNDNERRANKLVHADHAKIVLNGDRLELHVLGKQMHTFVNEQHYRVIATKQQQYQPP